MDRRLRRWQTRLQRLALVEAGGRAARLLPAKAAGVDRRVVLEALATAKGARPPVLAPAPAPA